MAIQKKVVIVGANFAGLACAMKLSRRYDVTVLDASPHFEFLPNIHELLSGVKTPDLLRLQRLLGVDLLLHADVGPVLADDADLVLSIAPQPGATAGGC